MAEINEVIHHKIDNPLFEYGDIVYNKLNKRHFKIVRVQYELYGKDYVIGMGGIVHRFDHNNFDKETKYDEIKYYGVSSRGKKTMIPQNIRHLESYNIADNYVLVEKGIQVSIRKWKKLKIDDRN